jgi:hypothetical protein
MAAALEREVARAPRFGHRVSLVTIDVDDFKGKERGRSPSGSPRRCGRPRSPGGMEDDGRHDQHRRGDASGLRPRPESLVDAADRALLRAKRVGKNQLRRPGSEGETGARRTRRRRQPTRRAARRS